MKKIKYYASVVVILILILNLVAIKLIKKQHINYQKEFLYPQIQQCGDYIESYISKYESELNRIMFNHTEKMHLIFSDSKTMTDIIEDLQDFYKKYRNLLSNIAIYDNSNSYLGLYIKDNDEFVVDTFTRQQVNTLNDKQMITDQNNKYLTSFPYFKKHELAGNIVAEINLQKFLLPILNLYKVDGIQWQWILNSNSGSVISNRKDTIIINQLDFLKSEIINGNEGFIVHDLESYSGKQKIISSYYPLSVLNNNLGIIFSMNYDKVIAGFSSGYLFLILLNFIVIVILVSNFLFVYHRETRNNDSLAAELLSLKMIVEHFPIGVMILDGDGIIKTINRTGQKMLFLDTDEGLIGKSFHDQFLVSNKYLLKDNINLHFDSNHYLLYEKDGNEVVIYRKEIKTHIAGDELTISALIDVSPFEKSRKQEAAANMAKSDFLAKMSHEIRTPMNGIICMTESLMGSELPVSQKEQVLIIKKSADLLMNVINDILDFSKIEAGKMMLEEIPFNLNEEIKYTLELFKPLAEEKNLSLISSLKPDVPSKLIGDPFRLRQVLSNLLSNAIKFTEVGKIKVNIEVLEKFDYALILLISVEDSGIGIEKEVIKKLFSSYEQGRQSTSRKKYGGTGLGMSIARQLVEMMNGEIWVESPASESQSNSKYPGSVFYFTIEIHSNEKLEKKYDFSSFNNYNQISALVLNKIKDERDYMHTLLDSFGINYNYNMYEDKTIDNVISHLEQKRDLYQIIVITDKPGHDGFVIANHLKDKRFSEYYLIIMISSNDKPGNYLKARNMGIDYYLIQPYESNEVFNILNENFINLQEKKVIYNDIIRIRPGLKILVVDDNLINQRVAQTIFKHLGYEIDIASNGVEAVGMSSKESYDIIFMDIFMPEMDGFIASTKIRKINALIPIIAMSAADDKATIDEALSSGMNDFIFKPVKVEVVKQILIKLFSESI